MKVLLIAQEPPLDSGKVVTGNAIRVQQLTGSLVRAGHDVRQVWLSKIDNNEANSFRNLDELRSMILAYRPHAVLVSYWHLLELLPKETGCPVILDFVAPRALEAMYQNPGQVRHFIRHLRINIARADLVLVGNEQQKSLLLMTLIEAGLDLREEMPIIALPLAASLVDVPSRQAPEGEWRLVSGGVNWPWRDAGAWWDAIDADRDPRARLVLFGGEYLMHPEQNEAQSADFEVRPLESWDSFSEYLSKQAHIGLELANENVERRYSQSFRSLEFLRHGLPLICNHYLPIADLIEKYDAGWLVDDPSDLPALLVRIFNQPRQWLEKSQNARYLVSEALDPDRVAIPLLGWLQEPHKAARLPDELADEAPVLGVPPWRQRLGRMAGLFRWVVLRRLFGGQASGGVVFISRGDLFPADHGAAVKIVETMRGIASNGREVGLVTDDRRYWWQVVDGELRQRRIPWFIRLLAKPKPLIKLLHFSKDIPQDNGFLYLPLTDGSFFWRTLYVGKRIGANTVQAEFPAYARPGIPASHILDAKMVMVEHNVEYERLRAQVHKLTDEQYRRYKAIEIDLCNQCDAVVCVSDNDHQRLALDGVQSERLHIIPHGVDLEQYQLPPHQGVHDQFDIPANATLIVYHGTFAYPPNAQALGVFARELLPRLDKLGLECHVLAVGRQPPANSPHPRIHLVGSVETVAPWLKAADMAVVPLLEGGGTRMKIIDYFAAGLPVVSTAKGIEGIPAEKGQDALVIDDWDEMAAAIVRLATDRVAADAIAARGRDIAQELDWKAIGRRYVELFESL